MMKKIALLLLLAFGCYGFLFGQLYSIKDYSETERSTSRGVITYGPEKGRTLTVSNPQTLEDYFTILHDEYGENQTQQVIDLLDNGQVYMVIEKLKLRGQTIKASVLTHLCDQINECSMTFVENGKVYTLTYEPAEFNSYGDFHGSRNLYLYRRDGHSTWTKVSGVIQTDVKKNPNLTSIRTYTALRDHGDNMAFGSVNVLKNEMVAMFVTNVLKKESSTYMYNDIILFTPKADGAYSFALYSTLNRETQFPEYVLSDGAYTVTNNEIKIETRNINTGQKNAPLMLKHSVIGMSLVGSDGVPVNKFEFYKMQ